MYRHCPLCVGEVSFVVKSGRFVSTIIIELDYEDDLTPFQQVTA
jgi:hypothetical protein